MREYNRKFARAPPPCDKRKLPASAQLSNAQVGAGSGMPASPLMAASELAGEGVCVQALVALNHSDKPKQRQIRMVYSRMQRAAAPS